MTRLTFKNKVNKAHENHKYNLKLIMRRFILSDFDITDVKKTTYENDCRLLIKLENLANDYGSL